MNQHIFGKTKIIKQLLSNRIKPSVCDFSFVLNAINKPEY